MEKLIADLREAADNLKTIISSFKIPLDTSTFDNALEAVLAAGKESTVSDSAE